MHMANLSQKYYKGDKCIDTQESQIAINAIVTDTTVETSAVESDYYCCPSCGAISRIKELMTGVHIVRPNFRYRICSLRLRTSIFMMMIPHRLRK